LTGIKAAWYILGTFYCTARILRKKISNHKVLVARTRSLWRKLRIVIVPSVKLIRLLLKIKKQTSLKTVYLDFCKSLKYTACKKIVSKNLTCLFIEWVLGKTTLQSMVRKFHSTASRIQKSVPTFIHHRNTLYTILLKNWPLIKKAFKNSGSKKSSRTLNHKKYFSDTSKKLFLHKLINQLVKETPKDSKISLLDLFYSKFNLTRAPKKLINPD